MPSGILDFLRLVGTYGSMDLTLGCDNSGVIMDYWHGVDSNHAVGGSTSSLACNGGEDFLAIQGEIGELCHQDEQAWNTRNAGL